MGRAQSEGGAEEEEGRRGQSMKGGREGERGGEGGGEGRGGREKSDLHQTWPSRLPRQWKIQFRKSLRTTYSTIILCTQ